MGKYLDILESLRSDKTNEGGLVKRVSYWPVDEVEKFGSFVLSIEKLRELDPMFGSNLDAKYGGDRGYLPYGYVRVFRDDVDIVGLLFGNHKDMDIKKNDSSVKLQLKVSVRVLSRKFLDYYTKNLKK